MGRRCTDLKGDGVSVIGNRVQNNLHLFAALHLGPSVVDNRRLDALNGRLCGSAEILHKEKNTECPENGESLRWIKKTHAEKYPPQWGVSPLGILNGADRAVCPDA